MDDLNCDFIHFFNTIYIKLIELCGSNLERFVGGKIKFPFGKIKLP